MTLPTTSEHRLVIEDYEEFIDAAKNFVAKPQLAETTKVIIIEEIDDTMREDKFRAVTTILTECSKHMVLKAFKWHAGLVLKWDDSSTRPAEFWEALTKLAPNLQHLSLDFYTHELHRMKETGISVSGWLF